MLFCVNLFLNNINFRGNQYRPLSKSLCFKENRCLFKSRHSEFKLNKLCAILVPYQVALNTTERIMNMVKKSITVTSTQNDWMKNQLKSGQYASDSELLRDLIRREQKRTEEIESIRQALIESENSGYSSKSAEQILSDFKKNRAINE